MMKIFCLALYSPVKCLALIMGHPLFIIYADLNHSYVMCITMYVQCFVLGHEGVPVVVVWALRDKLAKLESDYSFKNMMKIATDMGFQIDNNYVSECLSVPEE